MPTRILLTETQLKKALQTIVEQNEELLNRTIEEFEKVVRRYRNSDKNASALLKIGYAYFNIDEIEHGTLYFEEVLQQHPDAEEANVAKGRLASLNE